MKPKERNQTNPEYGTSYKTTHLVASNSLWHGGREEGSLFYVKN